MQWCEDPSLPCISVCRNIINALLCLTKHPWMPKLQPRTEAKKILVKPIPPAGPVLGIPSPKQLIHQGCQRYIPGQMSFDPFMDKQSKNLSTSLSNYLSAATSFCRLQFADAIISDTIFCHGCFLCQDFSGRMTGLESLHTETAHGKF